MTLVWTKEPPTEYCAWYWTRNKRIFPPDGVASLILWEWPPLMPAEGDEWAGPIPEPEEPSDGA